jgi:hypothetical protein
VGDNNEGVRATIGISTTESCLHWWRTFWAMDAGFEVLTTSLNLHVVACGR